MRPDWLRAATDAIRRDDRNTLAGAVAGLGAALAAAWSGSRSIIHSAGRKAHRASGKAIAVSRLGVLGSIL